MSETDDRRKKVVQDALEWRERRMREAYERDHPGERKDKQRGTDRVMVRK